jgi:hypothetical protein
MVDICMYIAYMTNLEQLLIHLEFKEAVKLHSIALKAPNDGSCISSKLDTCLPPAPYIDSKFNSFVESAPRILKLFVNRTNLVCIWRFLSFRMLFE